MIVPKLVKGPWDVNSLDDFRLYCCPECDWKHVHKEPFVNHAVTEHPHAKDKVILLTKVKLENDEELKPELPVEVKLEVKTTNECLDDDPNDHHSSNLVEDSYSDLEDYYFNDVSMLEVKAIKDDQDQPVKLKKPKIPGAPKAKKPKKPKLDQNLKAPAKMTNCDICAALFKNKNSMLSHKVQDHGIEDAFKCDQCDKGFKNDTNLHYHKRTVHEESSVTCDICGKLFNNKAGLSLHLRRFHHVYTIPQDKYIKKCDMCDTEFKNSQDFNSHMSQVHNRDKDFKCKDCDTLWVSHCSLEFHYVTCHNMIMYCCDICGYLNSQEAPVKRHKRDVHDKTYPHVCYICGKGFDKRQRLSDHLSRLHNIGEPRFKCDMCNKAFSSNKDLEYHIQGIHLRNKLYQCEQCDKAVLTKRSLQKHIRTKHHGKKG